MDNVRIVLLLALIFVIYLVLFIDNKVYENYGALQSLYSNDGAQDIYLTVPNDGDGCYDPYKYWRGVTWDLPTRNLNRMVFYPYLYEYYVDRYNCLWPYW